MGVAKVDGVSYRFMGDEELELYPVCGTSEQEDWTGKYTVKQPVEGWEKADLMMELGKKVQEPLERKKMNRQRKPNGEMSLFGYVAGLMSKKIYHLRIYI